MIISASSRTDIPAFYGEWFQRRLDAGYCISLNPFSGAGYRIGLRRDEVDGFVFWTKNLRPFLPRLGCVNKHGFPFIIHHTINGYSRVFEPSVPPTEEVVACLKEVATTYGSRVSIWRYDPIMLTSVTDFDFHRHNFARLARMLEGTVDEVIVSFLKLDYRKTRRNIGHAVREGLFSLEEATDDEKRSFLKELASIAAGHQIELSICAQPEYASPEVPEAACIDAERLSEVAGRTILGKKPGHRGKQCACDYSRDIGAYDTCLHGCSYCYAVNQPRHARAYMKDHDPAAEWLRKPRLPIREDPNRQLSLFGPEGAAQKSTESP
jgi:Domain of unknown function (DUF1848)